MDDVIIKIALTAILTGATSAVAVVAALKVHITYLKYGLEMQVKSHNELVAKVGVIENEVIKLNMLNISN
ncbi:hypothetical protein [Pseudoalteromonas sp. NZS37]|uniref:hypothetical protein n=1 Tax=unclassified Pseudoalteromonas TaxID=194690 RepID=UPI0018CF7971|nr:hypothetical protein [Pseudoalteromonas sp. NZS37]MBG9993333.1 hypothetical protein [Pseudoalteromonas sp. NZS37]